MIYDRNHISIEDDTNIALSEDTAARYRAYGWHVQEVDWTNGGTEYVENVGELDEALQAAREVTDRPSFISLRTIIGWPAPDKQNTGKAHGSALGDDEIAATKEVLGFDPEQTFEVSDEVIGHTRRLVDRGAEALAEWQQAFDTWASANPEGKALYDRMVKRRAARRLGGRAARPGRPTPRAWPPAPPPARCSARWPTSCRSCGAARPTWPSPTTPPWRASPASCPTDRQSKMFPGNPYGRTLHFGIREHAMGSIMNGIKVHGGTRPYGGTFLQFSDYMRAGGPAGGADAAAGHLRLDPRLDRPRRGRPDPPADRAPGRAAGHPRPGRGPTGRRQRDRRGLGGHPGATPTDPPVCA